MLVRMLVQTTYILGGKRVTLRPGDEVDVPDEVAARWCGRRKLLATPVAPGELQSGSRPDSGQEPEPDSDSASNTESKRRRKKED